MDQTIQAADIQGMVGHWLSTPENGYFGSSYGRNVEIVINTPMAAGRGDEVIAKLKTDVPILNQLPKSDVALYGQKDAVAVDKIRLFIALGGALVAVDAQGNILVR